MSQVFYKVQPIMSFIKESTKARVVFVVVYKLYT